MTKQELIISTLEKMGYQPKVDEDGDVSFRYQMKYLYVMNSEKEEPFVTVLFPQFTDVEDGKELLVLGACNKLTRDLKLAKVYIDRTFKNVSASCDFYYTNEESLEDNLKNSLHVLGAIRTLFRKELSELS
jgi:hypothetical protein